MKNEIDFTKPPDALVSVKVPHYEWPHGKKGDELSEALGVQIEAENTYWDYIMERSANGFELVDENGTVRGSLTPSARQDVDWQVTVFNNKSEPIGHRDIVGDVKEIYNRRRVQDYLIIPENAAVRFRENTETSKSKDIKNARRDDTFYLTGAQILETLIDDWRDFGSEDNSTLEEWVHHEVEFGRHLKANELYTVNSMLDEHRIKDLDRTVDTGVLESATRIRREGKKFIQGPEFVQLQVENWRKSESEKPFFIFAKEAVENTRVNDVVLNPEFRRSALKQRRQEMER